MKRKGQDIHGVLLLDKPVGDSSHRALYRAKRILDAKKAGHTGTLDPFATGLLVCCFGHATKISTMMLNADKRYVATLSFGSETDSGDLTGQVVSQVDLLPELSESQLLNVLSQFQGDIQQIPPMFSALKKNGKKLYEYARQGIEVERAPRTVTIHDIQLLEWSQTGCVIDVACSKGTYIRTLAQDIGRTLGCYAHLTQLRRTSVTPFNIQNALTLEQLEVMDNPVDALMPLQQIPQDLMPESLKRKLV